MILIAVGMKLKNIYQMMLMGQVRTLNHFWVALVEVEKEAKVELDFFIRLLQWYTRQILNT